MRRTGIHWGFNQAWQAPVCFDKIFPPSAQRKGIKFETIARYQKRIKTEVREPFYSEENIYLKEMVEELEKKQRNLWKIIEGFVC